VRFIIYGAGAVGGAIGGRMFEHGHDVILIARGAHYEAMRAGGLRLVDAEHDVTLSIPAVRGPAEIDWRPDDIVILGMKTQHTEAALRELAAVAPPTIALACAQNGVENERLALRHVADVYAICVMLPASHLEPGVVEVSSIPTTGLLDLGRYPDGLDDRAQEIASALATSTFESIPRRDVMRWKYCKLLMNLANAAQALCGNEDPDVGELGRRARSEAAAVLRAAKIDVASREEDQERRGDRLQPTPIAGAHRGGGSSWQSLQRGTGTIETDYLNGEIVLLGRLHGVPTPVNTGVQRVARELAARGAPPASMSVDDLMAGVTAASSDVPG